MNLNFTLWATPALKRTAFALLFITAAFMVQAQQKTWVGANNGTWNTASNWSPSGVPGATNDVVLNKPNTSIVMNTTATVASITIASTTNNQPTTLTFNSGGQLTVTGTVTVGSNGNRQGSIVMTNGGTLKAGSIFINSANNVGNALFTPGIGTVELTGTNTLPENINYNTFNNLVITGATTTTATPVTINGDLTGAGALTQGSGLITVGGNWDRASTASFMASTAGVTLTGSGKTISGGANLTFTTLTVNGNYTNNQSGTNSLTVNTALSGTGTLKQGGGANLNLSGTVSITNLDAISNPTNIVTYNGASAQTIISTTGNYGNGYGNLVLSGAGIKTLPANLFVKSNFTISGGTVTANGNTTTGGNFSLANGTTFEAGSYTQSVAGDFAATTGIINGTSTFDFNNSVFQTIGSGNFYKVVFSGGGNKVASGNLTVASDLTINANTTFSASPSPNNYNHSIGGNWINNGTFNAGTGTITFNGSAAQSIEGNVATTFERVTVDNTSASGITLNKTVTIGANGGNGSVTFISGVINTSSSNLLIIERNGSVTGASNASHVNGPVRKIGNDNFTFPVGKNGKYVPISISAPGDANDAFTAEYIPQSGAALGPISSAAQSNGLEAVSNCEYWILDHTAGSSAVDVTLTWGPDNACSGSTYINNPFFLVVAHFGGGEWNDFSEGTNNVISGTATGGTVTWKNVSTFSPFTIGTTDASQAPLPVTFISFTGKKVEGSTQLTWKVGGEVNVKEYQVERSTTGNSSFVKIGTVLATGNISYSFTDAASNGAVFYRIKNVDNDGRFTYSTILQFRNGNGITVFRVVPTLVTSNTVVQHDAATILATIILSTTDGKVVRSLRPATGSVQTTVDMSGLPRGLYLLKWSNGAGSVEVVKVVKQ